MAVDRCRLGLNPVAVDQWLTGWPSSVTCLTLTGSYRCSCQRIAPPGLSTIDAAPVAPVVVGPVFDPVVMTGVHAAPAVSVAYSRRLQYLLLLRGGLPSICRLQLQNLSFASAAVARRLQDELLLKAPICGGS